MDKIEAQYKNLVENSPDMIFGCDISGTVTVVNRKFCEIIKKDPEEIIGQKVSVIRISKRSKENWDRYIKQVCEMKKNKNFEKEYELSDGTLRNFHFFLSPLLDEDQKAVGMMGTIHDISETKKHEKSMDYLAYYDSLTELPNRLLLNERLKSAMNSAKQNRSKVAIIFFDLDNFKKINDTFGHTVGDGLLKSVSRELKKILRKNEMLARFGGDEFVMLLEHAKSGEKVMRFLERIRAALNQSFEVEHHIIHISSSIGVAMYPEDGMTCEELIKNADTAMYKAKEQEKNSFRFYNSDMRNEMLKRMTVEGHLGNALKNKELTVNYQPLIQSSSGYIRGCEALLRWESPILGKISPTEFIPIAEETGLIYSIGEWVLRMACRENKRWQELYGSRTIISVNISLMQLRQKNFIEMVLGILAETGLEARYLELEVTESIFIDPFDSIVEKLQNLRNTGVKISLDDFGTGFSSLNYLTRLPLDSVKIDKSFVQNIKYGTVEREMIQSIISLAHHLNLEIIAEGVEEKEQLQYLIDGKCDYCQGFLLFMPEREEKMEEIFQSGK